jgi:hypothetical protein
MMGTRSILEMDMVMMMVLMEMMMEGPPPMPRRSGGDDDIDFPLTRGFDAAGYALSHSRRETLHPSPPL